MFWVSWFSLQIASYSWFLFTSKQNWQKLGVQTWQRLEMFLLIVNVVLCRGVHLPLLFALTKISQETCLLLTFGYHCLFSVVPSGCFVVFIVPTWQRQWRPTLLWRSLRRVTHLLLADHLLIYPHQIKTLHVFQTSDLPPFLTLLPWRHLRRCLGKPVQHLVFLNGQEGSSYRHPQNQLQVVRVLRCHHSVYLPVDLVNVFQPSHLLWILQMRALQQLFPCRRPMRLAPLPKAF